MQAIHSLPFFNLTLGGMSVEMTMLAIASVLGMFQLLIAARSGNSQRTSSTPGAPMELDAPTKPSTIMRIIRQQVCQPDAARPPSMVALPAVSSRCIGCGSNSVANATISSRVTRRGPYSLTVPTLKSSK